MHLTAIDNDLDLREGSPPHVGWWNVTDDGEASAKKWAWWDGEKYTLYRNLRHGDKDFTPRGTFQFTTYWPDNPTVARLDPVTGTCTGSGPCPYNKARRLCPLGCNTPEHALELWIVGIQYQDASMHNLASFTTEKLAMQFIKNRADAKLLSAHPIRMFNV